MLILFFINKIPRFCNQVFNIESNYLGFIIIYKNRNKKVVTSKKEKKRKNGDEGNRTPGLNYAKVALYH